MMQLDSVKIFPPISDNNTRRLNFIPGRYLSEQEFDVMQQYVDERCEDLLLTRSPGIVRGLDILVPANLDESPVQVNPGLGISYSGRSVGVRLPIWFNWKDLCDNYREEQLISGSIKDGYYFLTVRRKVIILDEVTSTDPCTRTEPDPLRDSRLETLAQVNLQHLSIASAVMSFSRQRACVRIIKRLLTSDAAADNPNEIKIAVVKIVNEKAEWIDTQAARFIAQENSFYQTFLNYWHNLIRVPTLFRLDSSGVTPNPSLSLRDVLDVDYLPAAGKFPTVLIKNIAGQQDPDDVTLWDRPELQFNPDGLQIEIVPVPANSVLGVIQKELPRGVVDLLNGEADRIRLMVAVNSESYYPKLMDLPAFDMDLIQALRDRRNDALTAYTNWASSFYTLYEKLDTGATFDDKNIPDTNTAEIFSGVYIAASPTNAFPIINTDAKRKSLNVQNQVPVPDTVSSYLSSLAEKRATQPYKGKTIPRPYCLRDSIVINADTELAYIEPKKGTNGLMEQRVLLKKDIATIEDFIVQTNKMIDEVRDYLSHHRQQLDSITVSFASLAGGIPGDGTGLKLMRWADQLTFTAATAK